MALLMATVTSQVGAQTVAETIENACRILAVVDTPFMPEVLKKDALIRCIEQAKFYQDNAASSDGDKINFTNQRPAGNRFYHLADNEIAYTLHECLMIKEAICGRLLAKGAAWGIVLQDPEDILAAQAEAEAFLANT